MEGITQEQPVKRKRGRPRKDSLIVLPTPKLVSAEEPDPSIATSNALTRDNLSEYQMDLHVKNAPRLLDGWYDTVGKLQKQGNIKALEFVGQSYNIIPKSSGISIINNIQQNSVMATVGDNGAYFESIIRKVEGTERS